MAKPEEPRRLRWSVPRVDVSTNKWLDTQYDVSRSMQILIRESIQRDGYVDVANRPVEQLPRRGRPPQAETRTAEPYTEDDEQASTDDSAWVAADEASDSNETHDRRVDPPHSPADDEPQTTPAESESRQPADEYHPGGGQVDMDAIFGHNG